jgi:CelD/BcsL family acetyltransferase involved in cellulose biosynthesis
MTADLSATTDDSVLTLRRWSVADWMTSESTWTALLERSRADPLFLSWEWLTQWWRAFAGELTATAEILTFYRGETLIGIAPLYRHRVVRNGILPTSSVQLIGLSWRDPRPFMSEYLDVVAVDGEEQAVRLACAQALMQDASWTEWVIGFTAAGRGWRDAFSRRHQGSQYIRSVDRASSYQADLSGGFAAYLRSLGRSTRRSLHALRRRLAMQARVRFEILGPAEIESGFADLNRLHQIRWNKPAFVGPRLAFHIRLAQRLASRGELAASRLRVGEEVVSVLYDLRKGGCQYNISMGFNPAFHRKMSIALLHLGYAMESAAESRIVTYDLLAGSGQRSDYKRHLSQRCRELSCVQVLRGHLRPRLYRWHDSVRANRRMN